MSDSWQTETPTEMIPAQSEQDKKKYRDDLLMRWQTAKDEAARWKEAELDLRKQVARFLVPEPQKHEGMNTVPLENDWNVKVGIKLNYKLDPDNDKVWSVLDKISVIGNEGKFIAERLVSWHPSFLKTEYTTLQEEAEKGSQQAKDILKLVSEMLTITDATPTLEIREPKKKK